MSEKYVDPSALGENVTKTKEYVDGVRNTLDNAKQNKMEFSTMPAPVASLEKLAVLYTGATTGTYTQGAFYLCQEITPATDPKTYEWVEITKEVVFDSTLSNTSHNGIENQAVTNALQALQSGVVIIYDDENALPNKVDFAGGVIVAIGSVAFCVAEKTWHKVTAINSSSLAITWSAFNPNIALEETSTLPTASASIEGKCYLYLGSASGYQHGGIYQCQSDGAVTPTYSWVLISANPLEAGKGITIEGDVISADTNIFPGTLDEWNALTPSEQAKYNFVASPQSTDDVTDAVTDDDMRPVTSNAVYDKLCAIETLNPSTPSGVQVSNAIKIGNLVQVTFQVTTSAEISSYGALVTDLPIAIIQSYCILVDTETLSQGRLCYIGQNENKIRITGSLSNARLYGTLIYFTED